MPLEMIYHDVVLMLREILSLYFICKLLRHSLNIQNHNLIV